MPGQSSKCRLSLLITLVWFLPAVDTQAQEDLVVVAGSIVSMEFTAELDDGTVITNNVGKKPVIYEAGGTRILPALDAALRGLKAGDTKVVRVKATDAYGEVDDDLLVEVPLDQLPIDARNIGSVMVAENQDGSQRRVVVREIRDAIAIVDYNHPLAGHDLVYSVNILDVK